MPAIATMVGWVFSRLPTLPIDAVDGQLEYMSDLLYLKASSGWKAVGGLFQYASSAPTWPNMWAGTATSGPGGSWTVQLPAGLFTSVQHVQCTAVQTNPTTATAAFITISSSTTTAISGTAWTGSATVLLNASPLATIANVPINVLVIGV